VFDTSFYIYIFVTDFGMTNIKIRIETCCPNIIINIIKFCCVWLIHHCIYIYVLNTSGWQILKKKMSWQSTICISVFCQKPNLPECHKHIKSLTGRLCPLPADLLTKAFSVTPGHISLFSARVKYDEQFLNDSQIRRVS